VRGVVVGEVGDERLEVLLQGLFARLGFYAVGGDVAEEDCASGLFDFSGVLSFGLGERLVLRYLEGRFSCF
jgi:hypothetical protein